MNNNKSNKLTTNNFLVLLLTLFFMFGFTQTYAENSNQQVVLYEQSNSQQYHCRKAQNFKNPTGPVFSCTKYCKDCQSCETYCCAGTTPEDLDLVIITDDD